MYVAVDDTDSTRGNCTTFLATEIVRELAVDGDLDLIGCPRLVRLNPAIPWKTRGNGALVMEFGKGAGGKTFIGEIDGKNLYCYRGKTDWEPDPGKLGGIIAPLVEKFHDPTDSDPGVVISKSRPSPEFYRRGVTRVMPREDVENETERIGATAIRMGCGRGIIGCVCGMAWIPEDFTYELLSYRPVGRWGSKRIYDRESIREADTEITTSFNSWEERGRKVAMVPATPCPVMYGFRGDDIAGLVRGHEVIRTEPQSRWVVFLTNQGTDDHIIGYPPKEEFIPNSSYLIRGAVVSQRKIEGGHAFVTLSTDYGNVECGIYSPAREFRHVLTWLVPGDDIEVMGELREEPRTLNVEKIHVIKLAEECSKVSNPVCLQCGRTMSSVGKGKGFKCRRCGAKASEPIMRKEARWVAPGWYEPPADARRHLSKPLKRMGVEQPLGFIQCRDRTSHTLSVAFYSSLVQNDHGRAPPERSPNIRLHMLRR